MSDSGEREAGTTAQTAPTPEVRPEPAEPTPTPQPPVRGLSRRTWTLVFSSVVAITLVLVGAFVPVPYVALGPGPTFDTLSSVDGTPVVAVAGTRTYPTDGQLRMVTVSLSNQPVTLFSGLAMWITGRYALAPKDDYFPPGESGQQVEQENVQEFKDSQSDAEVSALRYLHYPISAVAQQVVPNTPADGRIHAGDKLVRVNGQTPNSAEGVQDALAGTTAGQTVDVVVQTGNQAPRDLKIKLGANPDQNRKQGFLGITPASHANVPFKITISLSDIGGPSAGLMFALAVVDKLTPGNLNGGMKVAGTGEIDDLGNVSPIGGIPFKLVAARNAGATVFLTPADNCSEAETHVPAGLKLVKVTSLNSAIRELADLKAGRPVPGC
ncbi:MAG TPA: PDZ domain-containing protein [Pseudonocardiaceae bacterium]|nr:PDZ domain-containing protein [Pseudonocardiaceae bacterium]